jgi:hypothetical protein
MRLRTVVDTAGIQGGIQGSLILARLHRSRGEPAVNIADAVAILAILIAPLAAVWAQRRIDRARERRNAKLRIFQVLMATRAARISPEHVQSLNSIDIEFYGRRPFGLTWRSAKEKAVVDAWKVYLDFLNTPSNIDPQAWNARGDDLFTELLYALSKAVSYDFDKVHLKRGIYTPQAHGWADLEHQAIRGGLAKILSGRAALPVTVTQDAVVLPPEPAPAQLPAGEPAPLPAAATRQVESPD